jgi:hypothetical protein
MSMGKPAPFVRALVEAVDAAMRAQSPRHGRSAMQRPWLAWCGTAVVVTHAMCWARFARARLGPYALAAWSWMFRPSQMPWAERLVARVRVLLRHDGLPAGRRVIADTDHPRSHAAKALAPLSTLRDTDSGGSLWGQSLVFLWWVTPQIALPVGGAFSHPAPECSAWEKQAKARKKPGVAPQQRPPQPPAHPADPTKPPLA